MKPRLIGHALILALLALTVVAAARAGDGKLHGTASWYGPGVGVATQWCTWILRHESGCGFLAIQSDQTGLVVYAPVSDWCQCLRGTPDERIVDLQLGVVAALGLDPAQGLFQVTTWRVDADTGQPVAPAATEQPIPNTAMAHP